MIRLVSSMSSSRLSIASVLVLWNVSLARADEQPILPTPPRQAEPWTPPPTSLPRFLISSTRTLFDQGLADPRGCEYHKIRLTVGSVRGGQGSEVATSGWLLPARGEAKIRYAVAWSGLVYPIVEDLGPADLDADVLALEDAAGTGRADVAPRVRRNDSSPFQAFRANNEASSVAVASPHPIKVCLLLRLGRVDLAESVWSVGSGRPKLPKAAKLPAPRIDLTSYGMSYLTLANDLAWYHFDRAICAHMRGDDSIALADARFLDTFAGVVNVKAEAMRFDRPDHPTGAGQKSPYFDFLEPLPALLADQERRAKERFGDRLAHDQGSGLPNDATQRPERPFARRRGRGRQRGHCDREA